MNEISTFDEVLNLPHGDPEPLSSIGYTQETHDR